MKLVKERALALACRPVGNTAQRSIGGNDQSSRTDLTAPDFSSGANIHSEATASPRPANTAHCWGTAATRYHGYIGFPSQFSFNTGSSPPSSSGRHGFRFDQRGDAARVCTAFDRVRAPWHVFLLSIPKSQGRSLPVTLARAGRVREPTTCFS
jgi:hypothetical protein